MKKKLAIKGHATRSDEVIKILEMLGGTNRGNCWGIFENRLYLINDFGDIDVISLRDYSNYQILYTLEEFLEKYPYKIGDKVRVPEFESEVRINDMKWDGYNIQYEVFTDETEWYTAEELNNWNNTNTKNLKKGPEYKIGEKVIYDGDVVEIIKQQQHIDQHTSYFYNNGLKSCEQVEPKEINQNPLLQQLKKYFEETPRDVIEKEWNELSYLNEIGPTVEEYLESVKKYRQTQYPKTYVECCKILGYSGNYNMILTTDVDNKLFDALYRLKVCCDAYWKIAGERMGLDKPWKPNWKGDSWRQLKYCITVNGDGELERRTTQFDRRIFAFPTEEMMNAFYENFKDKLEICKEFI